MTLAKSLSKTKKIIFKRLIKSLERFIVTSNDNKLIMILINQLTV